VNAAKQQWLVFSAQQHAFAADTNDIIEIVRINDLLPSDEPMPGILGWINVRGEMVPVMDLVEHIHHQQKTYDFHEIIVIKGKDQMIGLMAERILAVTQEGLEGELEHCVSEKSLLENVEYLQPNTLAVMRQS
jgi:purine-binding chemotaxis protein CheW